MGGDQPRQQVKGKVYFDIPKGAKLTKLELHDSMFSGGVKVRPLNILKQWSLGGLSLPSAPAPQVAAGWRVTPNPATAGRSTTWPI